MQSITIKVTYLKKSKKNIYTQHIKDDFCFIYYSYYASHRRRNLIYCMFPKTQSDQYLFSKANLNKFPYKFFCNFI